MMIELLEMFVVAQIFNVPRTLHSLNLVRLAPHDESTLVGSAHDTALILVTNQLTNTASASQA